MRITPQPSQQQNGLMRQSARISFQAAPCCPVPDILWFQWQADLAAYTSADGLDAFLLAMMLPAMMVGERLEVAGPVSAELVEGLYGVQHIFHGWYPELHQVDIVTPQQAPAPPQRFLCGTGVGFSGGVDSLFSLKWFLESPHPQVQPSHVLFGQFGPPLTWREEGVFRAAVGHFQPRLAQLGLTLLTPTANISDFYRPFGLWWGHVSFGLATAAMIHLFPGLYQRFVIAAGQSRPHFPPAGSTPFTDPLLSSQWIRLVNHGSSFRRVDKVVALADWPPAYELLNICTQRQHGVYNCCACEKCLRTILTLLCLNRLDCFTTFPLAKNAEGHILIPDWQARNLISRPVQEHYYEEILDLARQRGRPDVAAVALEVLNHYHRDKESLAAAKAGRPYSWMRQ